MPYRYFRLNSWFMFLPKPSNVSYLTHDEDSSHESDDGILYTPINTAKYKFTEFNPQKSNRAKPSILKDLGYIASLHLCKIFFLFNRPIA